MSVFAELKRRNVIRMAGLYLVGAWLVIQVAATLLPVFDAPAWMMKAVVSVLALGFVPALVFAWIFELTPDGLKRDDEVPEAASMSLHTGRRMERLLLGLLVIALAFFGFDKFVLAPRREAALVAQNTELRQQQAARPTATAPAKSIAVLAFTDLSPDHDQEYFSDGMAEELLNALAQVKGLKVAGRTSSFYYKGRNEDLRTIAKALGVAHVLEGSVRKQGNQVRITAQLIQASDGTHLWSQAYDGELTDIFELQEKIARAITDQLEVVLDTEQKARLVPVATSSAEAYALYLQATATFDRRDGEHMPEAIKQLEQAVALDPNYARAYSRLAALYAVLPSYLQGDSTAMREQVRAHARKAIALDPRLAEPWAVLGLVADLSGPGLIESREYFERALQLDPDDVTTNFWFGLALLRTGYERAGVDRIDHALAVDPMVPNVMRWRGVIYLRNGNVDGAEQFLKRAKAAGLKLAGRELGEIAARRGDFIEARRLWLDGSRLLTRKLPPGTAEALVTAMFGGDAAARERALAMVNTHLADSNAQVTGLLPLALAELGEGALALDVERTRVVVDNSDFMAFLFLPSGKSIRELPMFPEYLRAKGLPALWDKYGAPDRCQRIAPGDYRCD